MIKLKVGFLTNVNFMDEQVVVTPLKYQITRDGNEITLDVYIPSKKRQSDSSRKFEGYCKGV